MAYLQNLSRLNTLNSKDDSDLCCSFMVRLDDDILVILKRVMLIRFNADEVPVVGARAAGVQAINLDDDTVQAVFVSNLKFLPSDTKS